MMDRAGHPGTRRRLPARRGRGVGGRGVAYSVDLLHGWSPALAVMNRVEADELADDEFWQIRDSREGRQEREKRGETVTADTGGRWNQK